MTTELPHRRELHSRTADGILGALAAASGRLMLATGSRRLRSRFSEERLANLSAAEDALTNSRGKAFAGLGLFALSPVPSAQLFVAAGLLTVPLVPLTLAFFAGRLVSYSIYVGAASAAKDNFGGILTEAFASPLGVALQLLMLAGILLLVRIDWAKWLNQRGHPTPSSRGTTDAAQWPPEARNRGPAGCPTRSLRRPSTADMTEGVGVDTRENNESLMDGTGMGLLPGLIGALALIVFAMAALLTGSMWAVGGLLALIGIATAAIVFVVLAVTAEG